MYIPAMVYQQKTKSKQNEINKFNKEWGGRLIIAIATEAFRVVNFCVKPGNVVSNHPYLCLTMNFWYEPDFLCWIHVLILYTYTGLLVSLLRSTEQGLESNSYGASHDNCVG